MFDMNLNIYLVCQNCYLSIEKIHKILGFQINHTLVFSQFISSAQFLALIYIPRPIYYSIGRLIVVLSAKKATFIRSRCSFTEHVKTFITNGSCGMTFMFRGQQNCRINDRNIYEHNKSTALKRTRFVEFSISNKIDTEFSIK